MNTLTLLVALIPAEPPVIVIGSIPAKRIENNHGAMLEYVSLGPPQEAIIRYGNPWKLEIQYVGNKTTSLHIGRTKFLGTRVAGARHAGPQYPGGRWNGSRAPLTRPRIRFELPYRMRDN